MEDNKTRILVIQYDENIKNYLIISADRYEYGGKAEDADRLRNALQTFPVGGLQLLSESDLDELSVAIDDQRARGVGQAKPSDECVQRTKTVPIYSFDELSDKAKQKARDWWKDQMDVDLDYVIDEVRYAGQLMGIRVDTVPYTGFCSQGDGATFTGVYHHEPNAISAIAEYNSEDVRLVRIASSMFEVQRRNNNSLAAHVTHASNYCHAYSSTINVYRTDDGYGLDFIDVDMLKDILRDFMNWIYDRLRSSFDYHMSDESIDESIRINEIDFDVNGKVA
jgi:hypothetical protein